MRLRLPFHTGQRERLAVELPSGPLEGLPVVDSQIESDLTTTSEMAGSLSSFRNFSYFLGQIPVRERALF